MGTRTPFALSTYTFREPGKGWVLKRGFCPFPEPLPEPCELVLGLLMAKVLSSEAVSIQPSALCKRRLSAEGCRLMAVVAPTKKPHLERVRLDRP
jgi:hypothetical protein